MEAIISTQQAIFAQNKLWYAFAVFLVVYIGFSTIMPKYITGLIVHPIIIVGLMGAIAILAQTQPALALVCLAALLVTMIRHGTLARENMTDLPPIREPNYRYYEMVGEDAPAIDVEDDMLPPPPPSAKQADLHPKAVEKTMMAVLPPEDKQAMAAMPPPAKKQLVAEVKHQLDSYPSLPSNNEIIAICAKKFKEYKRSMGKCHGENCTTNYMGVKGLTEQDPAFDAYDSAVEFGPAA